MRIEEIKIYTFEELSEESKEKAIENYRNVSHEYDWIDESMDSLKAFTNVFNVKIKDYSLGEYNSYIRFSIDETIEENTENMSPMRLRTYIINNFYNQIYKGKYYSTQGYYDENKQYHYKFKYSLIKKEPYTCVLTGYCMDDNLLDNIYKFIKSPFNTNFYDLIDSCFDSFIKSLQNDIEYQNSDEYITEQLINNDYEFYENGKMY